MPNRNMASLGKGALLLSWYTTLPLQLGANMPCRDFMGYCTESLNFISLSICSLAICIHCPRYCLTSWLSSPGCLKGSATLKVADRRINRTLLHGTALTVSRKCTEKKSPLWEQLNIQSCRPEKCYHVFCQKYFRPNFIGPWLTNSSPALSKRLVQTMSSGFFQLRLFPSCGHLNQSPPNASFLGLTPVLHLAASAWKYSAVSQRWCEINTAVLHSAVFCPSPASVFMGDAMGRLGSKCFKVKAFTLENQILPGGWTGRFDRQTVSSNMTKLRFMIDIESSHSKEKSHYDKGWNT